VIIKNKILRFLVSFLLVLITYFILILLHTKGSFNVALKAMLAYVFFLFYIIIPAFVFMTYTLNKLLTPLKERTKEKTHKNKKISKFAIVGMILLVLILLFTLST